MCIKAPCSLAQPCMPLSRYKPCWPLSLTTDALACKQQSRSNKLHWRLVRLISPSSVWKQQTDLAGQHKSWGVRYWCTMLSHVRGMQHAQADHIVAKSDTDTAVRSFMLPGLPIPRWNECFHTPAAPNQWKRKDYTSWRQTNEKPSIILGCPKLNQCLDNLQGFVNMLLSSHLIIEWHDTLAIFVNDKRLQNTTLFSQQETEVGTCAKAVSVNKACTACQGKLLLQSLACQLTDSQCINSMRDPSQLGYAAVKQYI